jgi:hypothetical protein
MVLLPPIQFILLTYNDDDINNETDVNKMWETISDTVKSTAKERVGVRKRQRNKPWFDDECLKLHEERKEARQQWLNNNTEASSNQYNNAKRKATRVQKKARLFEVENSGNRRKRQEKQHKRSIQGSKLVEERIST